MQILQMMNLSSLNSGIWREAREAVTSETRVDSIVIIVRFPRHPLC